MEPPPVFTTHSKYKAQSTGTGSQNNGRIIRTAETNIMLDSLALCLFLLTSHLSGQTWRRNTTDTRFIKSVAIRYHVSRVVASHISDSIEWCHASSLVRYYYMQPMVTYSISSTVACTTHFGHATSSLTELPPAVESPLPRLDASGHVPQY